MHLRMGIPQGRWAMRMRCWHSQICRREVWSPVMSAGGEVGVGLQPELPWQPVSSGVEVRQGSEGDQWHNQAQGLGVGFLSS